MTDFDAYRNAHSDKYADIRQETALLQEPGALSGPIYVFGDPLHHTLSGRGQALKRSGWGWEVYLSEHWDALAPEIQDVRPAYIFIESGYLSMVQERAPQTWSLLGSQYKRLNEDSSTGSDQVSSRSTGAWFQLRQ